jgi:hypothetical protein
VLNNAAMKAEVTAINATIKANAAILNTQTVSNGATVSTGSSVNPVDIMVKRHNGFTYIYAVSMRKGMPTATFTLRDFSGTSTVEVVGENRTITATNGVFQDAFTNWGVHIYKVATYAPTSVAQIANENPLQVFVKKTADGAILNIENNQKLNKIEIFDMSGRKLYTKNITGYSNKISINVKLPQLILIKAFTGSEVIVRKCITN